MNVSKTAPTGTRQTLAKGLRKRWPVIALVIVLIVTGAAAVTAAQGAFRNMLNVASISKKQFDGIAVGGQVDFIIETISMSADKVLVGNFLEPGSDGAYRRTPDSLSVAITPDTSIVMGQLSALKPGAVLQIRGQRTNSDSITAQSIVILTGYITVK